ncbi:MAG: VanZ family protein [Flavobacteriaceae bacterium]
MLLIIVGSISNLIDVPWQNIELQDKIIHFVAYALLCFLLFLMIESYKLRNNLKYSILVSIVFGAAIEFLQLNLTSYRSFEIFDIIANVTGILIMAKVIALNKTLIVKKLETFM